MTETKDGLYLEIAKDIMVAFADKVEITGKSPEAFAESLGAIFNILAREIKKADLDLRKVKTE
jgi:hypothetical protein